MFQSMNTNLHIKELVSKELEGVIENSFAGKTPNNIVTINIIFENCDVAFKNVTLESINCKLNKVTEIVVSNVKLQQALCAITFFSIGRSYVEINLSIDDRKLSFDKNAKIANFNISCISEDKCMFSIYQNNV